LEFINGRIDEINSEKRQAVKKAKRNAQDQAALDLLDQYQKSIDDDINLMAKLANAFDEKWYNRLAGET
jgi:hypothetical protein